MDCPRASTGSAIDFDPATRTLWQEQRPRALQHAGTRIWHRDFGQWRRGDCRRTGVGLPWLDTFRTSPLSPRPVHRSSCLGWRIDAADAAGYSELRHTERGAGLPPASLRSSLASSCPSGAAQTTRHGKGRLGNRLAVLRMAMRLDLGFGSWRRRGQSERDPMHRVGWSRGQMQESRRAMKGGRT